MCHCQSWINNVMLSLNTLVKLILYVGKATLPHWPPADRLLHPRKTHQTLYIHPVNSSTDIRPDTNSPTNATSAPSIGLQPVTASVYIHYNVKWDDFDMLKLNLLVRKCVPDENISTKYYCEIKAKISQQYLRKLLLRN